MTDEVSILIGEKAKEEEEQQEEEQATSSSSSNFSFLSLQLEVGC
jgi:hypothetical protein